MWCFLTNWMEVTMYSLKTLNGLPVGVIFMATGDARENSQLSDLGETQIRTRAHEIQSMIDISDGRILQYMSSSHPCAKETCRFCYGGGYFDVLPELDFPSDDACMEDRKKFGYTSLDTYINQGSTAWLFRYGLEAVEKIGTRFRPEGQFINPKPEGPLYIGIVGHATLLNMIALLMYPQHASALRRITFSEGEALVVVPTRFNHRSDRIYHY